jgi:hypothetical protein
MKRVDRIILASLSAAIVCLTMSGCVRRRLTVRTNPPGALISVDNQIIGTSPAATSFTYYGTREIRVERDGFRTETIARKLNPPWYEIPPLDFITETLWPLEIRDERVIDIEMVPKQIDPIESVVSRANDLRNQAQMGVVTAPPNISVPSSAQAAPVQVITPPPNQLPRGGVSLP